MEWRCVDRSFAIAVHDQQLAVHGGGPGIRDEGLLDSALARPQNLAAYEKPDLAALAGKAVRLRFVISDADIYSFIFQR